MTKNLTKVKTASFFVICFFMLSLFSVSAQEIRLVPSGKAVGVKLYTDGILVIGTSQINNEENQSVCPARKSSIRANDVIEKVNGNAIKSIEELSEAVNENPDSVTLTIRRDSSRFDVCVTPVKDSDGTPRLGLWVRDSTAGIGTVTFINPQNRSFGALGHGICDVDTGNILSVKSANILNCTSLTAIKGKRGAPGELGGVFGSDILGNVTLNTGHGIFGTLSEKFSFTPSDAIPVCPPSQVTESEAYILSDIDQKGIQKYSINIKKSAPKSKDKGIVFEVTDKNLIDKTGGIIQGMSGSPIIQDGKFVGAVTHVFVNDPTRGYGIFIENMLAEAEKIK